jgi:superfamily II DNA or RNA helicase
VLRPYQSHALAAIRAEFEAGSRAVVAVSPTGSGKTVLIAEITRRAVARGGRVLVVVHRRELARQTVRHLRNHGLGEIRVILGGDAVGPAKAPVVVGAIQTLIGKGWRERLPPASLVLWDECFPAGTPVAGRPIEKIRVGMLVPSFDHETGTPVLRRVARTYRGTPAAMVRVHLESGRSFACTPGHPVFSSGAYVAAIDLAKGALVHGCDPVRVVQHAGSGGVVEQGAARRAAEDGASVLLANVLERLPEQAELGDDERDEPSVRACANEDCEPDVVGVLAREGLHDAPAHGAPTVGSAWERDGADGGTGAAGRGAGLADGARDRDRAGGEAARPLDALQDRSRRRGEPPRDRDRRGLARGARAPGAGREEGRLLAIDRVVGVEVLERGGDGTFGGVCPDGRVYNLEVEGTHNYFADGLLVHNCHHIKAPSFLTVRDAYAAAHHIGFTATPERADRSPLGDVFDAMVVVAETAALIDEGFLVPCDVWAPAGGRKALAADPVDAYLEHGEGKRAIVFCSSVAHARDVAERLGAAGVSSEQVDGSMPTRERDAALARFASGATQVITNCNLITEGFDVPAAKCVVLARGCDSVAMYLQAVGRALRPEPGQPRALLLDLRGAVHRHGLPDAKREFSLEGEPIRRADRAAPIQQCRVCGAVFSPRPTCPMCGGRAPAPKPPKISPEELLQIARAESPHQRRAYFEQLCALAAERGYRRGWAYHRFVGRYGHPPQEVA